MRLPRSERASRNPYSAVRDELLGEIRSLRTRVKHVAGSLVTAPEGPVLVQDTHGADPAELVRLTCVGGGWSNALMAAAAHTDFLETVVTGPRGHVALYAAGPDALLAVLAGPETNVGRLHLEARQTAARVAVLLETVRRPR